MEPGTRLPLTEAQTSVWTAHQVDPTGRRYTVGEWVGLNGPIDPVLFESAWRRLVAESEVYRLRAIESGDGLQQHLRAGHERAEWQFVECSAADATAWMQAATGKRIDPGTGPLTECALFMVGENEFRWYHGGHHVAYDAYSSSLLTARLAEIYSSLVRGEGYPASAFGTMRELLAEEAGYRSSDRHALDRAYWTARLKDLPEPIRLGSPQSDPPDVAFLRSSGTVDETGVRAAARAAGVHWAAWIVAATAAYLHQVTGQCDVVLSLPVTARSTELALRTPGMLANLVPLRLTVRPTDGLADLAVQATTALKGALVHQRYRHDDLRRAVRADGGDVDFLGPSLNILAAGEGLVFGDVRGIPHNLATGGVEDLAITVHEGAGELRIDFDGDPGRYGSADLDGHRRRFLRLFEAAVAEPRRPLGEFDLVDPSEYRALVHGWNSVTARCEDRSVPSGIERQAESTPDAVAVECGEVTLSYRELDTRANQLANQLRDAGVTAGSTVGVLLDRGVGLSVALLAVWKAGAAYLPLDPSYPAERVGFLLDDAKAAVSVTASWHAHLFPGDTALVKIDADEIGTRPAERPFRREEPDQVAYVIYTSGSTGRPKGVRISHRSLVDYIWWAARDLVPAGRGGSPVFSSVAFDLVVTSLWAPLVSGQRVWYLPPESTVDDLGPALAAAGPFSFVKLTPSHLDVLCHQLSAERAANLTGLLVLGGEQLAARTVKAWHDLSPKSVLLNEYGPTEATVGATVHRVETGVGRDPVPIGLPRPNTTAYVLDARLRPVPIGLPGELYLGGSGLAQAYNGQAGLTAARFVPDPFGARGSRLYRTGDLARRRPDGGLEFLGRTDHQVKIRGYRVEPAEVEAVLAESGGVRDAVVIAEEDASGGKRLIGYVAADPSTEPAALLAMAGRRLPAHLVPAAIVVLDRLPLTPNGKLDRAALPAPDFGTSGPVRAPRTATAEILCEIYAELLGVRRVEVTDSFFALGGDSLSAVRLVSRIRAVFGVELPVRLVFDAPAVTQLLSHLDDAAAARPPVRAVPRPARIPLSSAQQRLWFLNRLHGSSSTYDVPFTITVSGPLDVPALRAAFGDVVARHETLRTVFPDDAGVPNQLVLSVSAAEPVLDVTPSTRDGLSALIEDRLRRGFDLSRETPLRAELFALGGGEYVVLLVLHHIAGDGWSFRPLTRDLAAAYAARASGEPPQWTDLPVQYADYTLWHQELLSDVEEQQAKFWADELRGLPDELELPYDRPRPAVADHRGGIVPVHLPERLHRKLAAVARSSRVSLFMVLQAAFAVLLTRLGAGSDIAIGTPHAGRADEALDDLVGMFVNPLTLRTDTSGDPVFGELLARVRTADLAAYAHQDLPFERVVDAVSPLRSTAKHPLFQVMLALQERLGGELPLPGLTAVVDRVETKVAQVDLQFALGTTVTADGGPGGIDGQLEYALALFDHETGESLVRRWTNLLESIVADPGRRIGDFEILDEEERRQLLDWTRSALPDRSASLPGLVERQAARTPDAVAVHCDGAELTYRELNAAANRLAHELIGLGAGRGSVVGVYLDRSAELIITALAVLKSGAAYLPLDPEYPSARLTFMATDAAALLVVTERRLAAQAPGARLVFADEPGSWAHRPATDPAVGIGGDDVAYLIYTSGSTGQPKGVLGTHLGAVNRIHWTQRAYFEFTPDDVVLFKTPTGFDVSVGEIFGPLAHGARLVVSRSGGHRDPGYLRSMIGEHGVTQVYFAPTMLALMLAEGRLAECRSLRKVQSGGEELPVALARDVLERMPWCELYNQYGPTEAAIDCAAWHVRRDRIGWLSRVPIGAARDNIGLYENVQLHVLGTDGRPAPPGSPGELVVGGAALAHGYANRPALTAERFVPNPYGRPGSRLYRTGDRARWTTDGRIEFLGRADDQVKLNGARIELGEIEAALTEDETVSQAVVAVRAAESGDRRLMAYVVPVPGATVEADRVRDGLSTKLPEFMVPSVVVTLAALPLTPNGKADRAALPEPSAATPSASASPEPVTGPARVLAALCAELLGVDQVGADDSFFDLGGDSIMSIQLVSRARAAGLEFTPRDVFRNRTVRALADVAKVAADALPEVLGSGTGSVPLTPIMAELAGSGAPIDAFNQSTLSWVPPAAGADRLAEALQSVVDRHDMLRAILRITGDGAWRLEARATGSVDAAAVLRAVSIVDFDNTAERELITESATEARQALAPREGRMLQAVWFDAGPERPGKLLLVVHHLVIDAVSWRIVLPDLQLAWERTPLDPVGTSFRRWARGRHELAAAGAHDSEIPLWTDILASAGALPVQRALDPEVDRVAGARELALSLPPEVTGPLLTEVPAAFRCQINDVLLTALALAVNRWRDAHGAVLVDLEAHGRDEDEADLSHTVGWFTTVHPARLDPGPADWDEVTSGGEAALTALKAVKEQLRGIPAGGAGYGALQQFDRLDGLAVPQILFNYLGRMKLGDARPWSMVVDAPDLGPGADPGMPMAHTIEINARTHDDGAGGLILSAKLSWPEGVLSEPGTRELGELWFAALRGLVRRAGLGGGGLTPADLPLVALNQAQADQVQAAYPEVEDVLPVTSLQEAFLFHAQLAEDGFDLYSGRRSIELAGPLDPDALLAAGNELVARHSSLRTAFMVGLSAPVQVVLRGAELPWQRADLSTLDSLAQESAAELLIEAQRDARFSPDQPPLLRFLLIKLAPERHRLVVVNHHLVLDGWSLSVLVRELLAMARGMSLPPATSYTEYVRWLAGRDTVADRAAWVDALDGLPGPTLVAPALADQPVVRPERIRAELPAELAASLAAVPGLTMNTLVEGAWGLLLSKLTGQQDVVFGTTVSGRPPEIPGIEGMVGMVVNTIPVRVRIRAGEPVGALLARIQDEQARLSEHHHVGLAEVQRDAGVGALFDTSVVLFDFPPDDDGTTDGLRVTGVAGQDDTEFSLRLSVEPGGVVNLDYRPDGFTGSQARAHLDRYLRLLETVVTDPGTVAGDLEVVTEAEHEVLLREWGGYGD